MAPLSLRGWAALWVSALSVTWLWKSWACCGTPRRAWLLGWYIFSFWGVFVWKHYIKKSEILRLIARWVLDFFARALFNKAVALLDKSKMTAKPSSQMKFAISGNRDCCFTLGEPTTDCSFAESVRVGHTEWYSSVVCRTSIGVLLYQMNFTLCRVVK